MLAAVRTATYALARALKVFGLMNVQFAIKDGQPLRPRGQPRASRTVPFVAKAIGVPLAKLAARVMAGAKLKDLGLHQGAPAQALVRQGGAVFPLHRFPGAAIMLSPEIALDRRGLDGRRSRHRLCQDPARGQARPAPGWQRCFSA